MDRVREDLVTRLAFDLMATWQARALVAARGKTAAVLLSVLAHNYDEQLLTLLKVAFPGFESISAPFLSSAGRVAKSGAIVADVVQRDGRIERQEVLYRNEIELRDDFRRLADALKLDDSDREQLFIAVKKWVVADHRLDPTMDPQDPDAKRLH
jgi:hypothetical protein